jgi:excisionase family DNA binding protein
MNVRWITVSDVAKRLFISRPTAAKLLQDGKIPGLTSDRYPRRVEREVFEKWHKSKDRSKLSNV